MRVKPAGSDDVSVSQCHHKQSFSGVHSPRGSYCTSQTHGYNFKEEKELCLNKHALSFALFSFQFQLSSNLNS